MTIVANFIVISDICANGPSGSPLCLPAGLSSEKYPIA